MSIYEEENDTTYDEKNDLYEEIKNFLEYHYLSDLLRIIADVVKDQEG